MNKEEYMFKARKFLTDNNIQSTKTDPISKYVGKTVQSIYTLLYLMKLHDDYFNLLMSLPHNLLDYLKLHKSNIPVRPHINCI